MELRCTWQRYRRHLYIMCDAPATTLRSVVMNGTRREPRPLCADHARLCQRQYDRPNWQAEYTRPGAPAPEDTAAVSGRGDRG